MVLETPLEMIRETLPMEQRLALSYSSKSASCAFLAVLGLDARLASVVRGAREPVLGQIRLAWWREQLGSRAMPKGEPLLALMHESGLDYDALIALVDGWEGLLGEDALSEDAVAGLAIGRSIAMGAAARILAGESAEQEARRAARGWALADIAARITEPLGKEAAIALAAREDWSRPRLAAELRPLLVLHGLGRRRPDGRPLLSGVGALPLVLRLGLIGV